MIYRWWKILDFVNSDTLILSEVVGVNFPDHKDGKQGASMNAELFD